MRKAKSPFYCTKKQVTELLNKQLRFSKTDLECAQETSELMLCWSNYMVTKEVGYDPKKCEALEIKLVQCEATMGNKTKDKLRKDLRRSLVHQMMTHANKHIFNRR